MVFGLLPQKIDRHQLRPGDHICTDRNLKTYYHHGIYIGDDRVVHFGRKSSEEEYKCHHGLGERDIRRVL
jgi:cell wall-associated NlpC family hydrolase